jgi:lysophospholipase L1-like esterase
VHNHVNERYYHTVAASIRQFAAERGVPYLDLYEVFAAQAPAGVRALFLDEPYHHYAPSGNELVARSIDQWLGSVVGGYPGRS